MIFTFCSLPPPIPVINDQSLDISFNAGVYPNSTTILLDRLTVGMYSKFDNYSDIDQHVTIGLSLHQDLMVVGSSGFIHYHCLTVLIFKVWN